MISMNIEDFLKAYVAIIGKVEPTDRVVVLDPKSGREYDVVGLHYIPETFSPVLQRSKLVIELE